MDEQDRINAEDRMIRHIRKSRENIAEAIENLVVASEKGNIVNEHSQNLVSIGNVITNLVCQLDTLGNL